MTATASPTLTDRAGKPVRLGRELGRGGQGAVFQVEGPTPQVAKVYLSPPDAAQTRKLAALVGVRTPELEAVSAWPSAELFDTARRPSGFLMPLIPAEFRELHSLYSPGSRRKHFPQADWAFLVHTARNVARAFATVHAAGHLMGDVSGRNVMVSPQGTVRLIDTDSFQVTWQGEVFPCPVGTAEFTPPELQGQSFGTLNRTANHDLFGVALLIFHLLFEGRHPYAGIHASGQQPSPAEAIAQDAFAYARQPKAGLRKPPGTLSLLALPTGLQDLFEQAFSPTHGPRPTAEAWEAQLAELAANLSTCSKNPKHKHWAGVPCPWCHLHGLIRRASPIAAGLLAGQKLDVGAELARLWAEVGKVTPPSPPQPMRLITAGLPLPALPLNLPPKPKLSETEKQAMNAVRLGMGVAALLCLGLLVRWMGGRVGGLLPLLIFLLVILPLNATRMSRRGQQEIWQAGAGGYRFLERKLLGRFAPQQGRVQAYQAAIERREQEVGQQLLQLSMTLAVLEKRYATENAYAEYGRDLAALQGRRDQILDAQHREREALRALTDQYARRALTHYLQAQPLTAQTLPDMGPSLLAHLQSFGLRTAFDIRDDVLNAVPNLPNYQKQRLRAWRQGLENFFQFDPRIVPQNDLDRIRQTWQSKASRELRELEKDVQRFGRSTWGANEQALLAQIREVKRRIAQHGQALEVLEKLSG